MCSKQNVTLPSQLSAKRNLWLASAVAIAVALFVAACVPMPMMPEDHYLASAPPQAVNLIYLRTLDVGSLTTNADSERQFMLSGPGNVSAVAVRGNDMWLIDQSTALLFHVDLALQESRAIATIRHPGTHGLFIANDDYVYVVDQFSRSVKQFDSAGNLVRTFTHPTLLAAPVDVAVTEFGAQLIVADAMRNHLVVFDLWGNAVNVLGSDRSNSQIAQSISAIATAGRRIIIVDPLMNEVSGIDLSGNRTENYGEDELSLPVSVAADRCGRVYIADGNADGLLVGYPDTFQPTTRADLGIDNIAGITDLWIDDDRLYVASGDRGITTYLVTPPCLGA